MTELFNVDEPCVACHGQLATLHADTHSCTKQCTSCGIKAEYTMNEETGYIVCMKVD